jgi:bacterioferritin
MGTTARKLVGAEVEKILKLLNKAFADEWLAYYQYWLGAQVAEGMLRGPVASEFMEHANEELKHAQMIADRVIQLGGKLPISPEDWYQESNCGYDAPKKHDLVSLLKQNIQGERCAIGVYNNLIKATKDKDEITYQMAFEILKDEIEHENDLETLLADLG